MVERALQGMGLKVQNPVLSLPSTEAIKSAVAAGVGVAIVSRQSVLLELRARRLVTLPVAGLKIERPLYLARLRRRPQSAAATAFERLLRHEVPRLT